MRIFVERTKVKKDGTLIIQREVEEIAPYTVKEAEEAIRRVCKNESVIMNLEIVPMPTAQRMLDFATGAMFAIQGRIRKIKGEKYLLTPQNAVINRIRESR